MWVVKVTLHTDGNEFASVDHVGRECFTDQWAAYYYTKENVEKGYRVNVYEGIRHVGTYEGY